jgi:glycerol-3-phosphate acyltransferase PlsX
VIIKLSESFYEIANHKGIKDEFFARFNYEQYGGSPIVGVNASVVVGHGISTPEAIKNMVLLSKTVYESGVIDEITRAFQ